MDLSPEQVHVVVGKTKRSGTKHAAERQNRIKMCYVLRVPLGVKLLIFMSRLYLELKSNSKNIACMKGEF